MILTTPQTLSPVLIGQYYLTRLPLFHSAHSPTLDTKPELISASSPPLASHPTSPTSPYRVGQSRVSTSLLSMCSQRRRSPNSRTRKAQKSLLVLCPRNSFYSLGTSSMQMFQSTQETTWRLIENSTAAIMEAIASASSMSASVSVFVTNLLL